MWIKKYGQRRECQLSCPIVNKLYYDNSPCKNGSLRNAKEMRAVATWAVALNSSSAYLQRCFPIGKVRFSLRWQNRSFPCHNLDSKFSHSPKFLVHLCLVLEFVPNSVIEKRVGLCRRASVSTGGGGPAWQCLPFLFDSKNGNHLRF